MFGDSKTQLNGCRQQHHHVTGADPGEPVSPGSAAGRAHRRSARAQRPRRPPRPRSPRPTSTRSAHASPVPCGNRPIRRNRAAGPNRQARPNRRRTDGLVPAERADRLRPSEQHRRSRRDRPSRPRPSRPRPVAAWRGVSRSDPRTGRQLRIRLSPVAASVAWLDLRTGRGAPCSCTTQAIEPQTILRGTLENPENRRIGGNSQESQRSA